jgi:putative acetyltransferase
MRIKVDDLDDGAVIELLSEHHEEMNLYSPPESIHALDEASLKDPAIMFWSVWSSNELAGCGALKKLSNTHGEIKSMRTSNAFRRQGVAERILQQILNSAKSRSYQRVSLETGTNEAFIPAIKLYKKYGFNECVPFGSYKLDPFSMFFTKEMESA